MIKSINYFIQAIIIYLFFLIGKIIRFKIKQKFLHFYLVRLVLFLNLKIIEKNLTTFNSNLTTQQKEKIISAMWNNYGITFIEYVFLKLIRENNDLIKTVGADILNRVTSNNRPVIFVSGHFSNFELMSMEITKRKIKLATIYRPLNNYF